MVKVQSERETKIGKLERNKLKRELAEMIVDAQPQNVRYEWEEFSEELCEVEDCSTYNEQVLPFRIFADGKANVWHLCGPHGDQLACLLRTIGIKEGKDV